jgi:phage shock protein A|tara:strand:+ start:714 stop:911 length:198 start_codon:yes stop_codon:yes gene_type:complete
MKEKILTRKKELEKQAKDLVDKINQGREAIRNMESSVGQIQGAIQQCNWTIDELELKDDTPVAKK